MKIHGLKFSNSHSDPAFLKAVGPSRSPPPPTPRLKLNLYLRLRSFNLRLCMPNPDAEDSNVIKRDTQQTHETHKQTRRVSGEMESCRAQTQNSVTKCKNPPDLLSVFNHSTAPLFSSSFHSQFISFFFRSLFPHATHGISFHFNQLDSGSFVFLFSYFLL